MPKDMATEIEEYKTEKETKNKKEKVIIVLPAYNTAKTLAKTVSDIPKETIDDIILVDDASFDNTIEVAKRLGLLVFTHSKNRGYGANQKTCYIKALELEGDIIVMLHPDYQYDPQVVPQLIEPIKQGKADAVFGSRMMKGGALEGGMPRWKYYANIFLTAIENFVLGIYLTEYHSGLRAYSARLLKSINFQYNSDGFVFDTEIIIQAILHRFKIVEIPIRTRYFPEASTIKFWPALLYGLGILKALFKYCLYVNGIIRLQQFE
jgi:glycosyltransferase involved in cell wall biosynthesis